MTICFVRALLVDSVVKKMNGWIGFEFVVALLLNGHTTHMQTDRSTLRCVKKKHQFQV